MIPTFNCASFLRQTLENVLAQDRGPEQMQIEVVDDCSTMDDPERVVHEVGRGRISFHRKAVNQGAIANFNTCIERSRGHFVHILHGDDYLLPGFYSEIEKLVARCPDRSLYATRCLFVDESGQISGITPELPCLVHDSLETNAFWDGNPLQFAGVVMRRSFFEQHGGFCESLVHCADWDMWRRATLLGRAAVSPFALACYRMFAANDTGRLMRTGENLRDILRFHLRQRHLEPGYPLDVVIPSLHARAQRQADNARQRGDEAAAGAATEFADGLQRNHRRWERIALWWLYGLANSLRKWAAEIEKRKWVMR